MSSVERQDVKDWAKDDSRIVQVMGVEQGREEDPSSAPSSKHSQQSSEGRAHVHEGDNIKSSYDVEEDVPPSLFQKLKGAFIGAENKFQSNDARHAQNADPHPRMTAEGPGMFSHLQQSLWGTKKEEKNAETVSSKDAAAELKKPVGSPVKPDRERGQLSSDELGTGYEEDTEKGGLSSDNSMDLSDTEGSLSQPESLFKPVKETNSSKFSLEDLRANKTNKVSSPDEVKAPGVLGRAKEEVEAVTEAALEGLNLKDKRAASGDQHESVNQDGFFSRIAEKIGYGGHGRSQSH